jgi:hypothetical protein
VMDARQLQRLIDHEAARQKAIPTLAEARRMMAEPSHSVAEKPDPDEEKIRQALDIASRVGIAVGRQIERRSR